MMSIRARNREVCADCSSTGKTNKTNANRQDCGILQGFIQTDVYKLHLFEIILKPTE